MCKLPRRAYFSIAFANFTAQDKLSAFLKSIKIGHISKKEDFSFTFTISYCGPSQ